MSHAISTEENSIDQEFATVSEEILCESAVELFEEYGKAIARCEAGTSDSASRGLVLGAAIGFTGEFVRGALAIAIDEELAVALDPLAGQRKSDRGSLDWIGELANQMLGRVKNKLLSYNVEIGLSTPIVIEGAKLRMFGIVSKGMELSFQSGDHFADVWWDAEVDPVLVLSKEDAPDVQLEGEMLLF